MIEVPHIFEIVTSLKLIMNKVTFVIKYIRDVVFAKRTKC